MYGALKKKERGIAILSTLLGGLIAHAYRFFNFLPIHDSVVSFEGTGATYSSGRWFLEFAGKVSSSYDMPWVNGGLSLLYISIVTVLLVELLEIKKTSSIVITGILLVTFPTVTATFAYMFTADGYMLAYLLAVLGIYLTDKYKFGFLLGALCICLSMSTYQAYLSVSLMVILILCAKRILVEGKNVFEIIALEYKQAIAVVGGALLNKVMTTLVNTWVGVSLSGYQGINDVHMLTLEDTVNAIFKTFRSLEYFYQIGRFQENNWWSYLNTIIFAVMILLTIYYLIKNKTYKKPLELFLVVLGYCAIPICAYVICLVSMQVTYHALMVMSLCIVYLLLVVMVENLKDNNFFSKIIRVSSIVVLCSMCYYNIIHANISYFKLNLSYEKSYAVCVDILNRIETLEKFDGTQPITVVGDFMAHEENKVSTLMQNPEMPGISEGIIMNDTSHYIGIWDRCMGRKYERANAEAMEAVIATSEFQNMNVYPFVNSVELIDDVVVVKLSELKE